MNAAATDESLPGWMRYASCAQIVDAVLPWTTDTDRLPPVLVEMMREVCADCPVQLACAAYAASEGVTGGFWAGIDRAVKVDQSVRHPAGTVQMALPLDLPEGGAA